MRVKGWIEEEKHLGEASDIVSLRGGKEHGYKVAKALLSLTGSF